MPDRTRDYRRNLALLRLATIREYRRLWPLLDPTRLDATFPGYAAAVARLVSAQRATAGTLARSYLSATRSDAGVETPAPVAETPPIEAQLFATSLAVTSVVSIKKAMTRGDPINQAATKAFVASAGVITKLVENASRDTVRAAVDADPAAEGWTRVYGGGCDWCADLADGTVLPGSVEMAAHDHCACTAQPVYT